MAEVTLKAMGLMKYDAVALGPQDLLLGPNPLKALLSAERLPVAASNLVSGETGAPFEKPYVLVEKEGIRVGILSVMPPASQEAQESNPFLKAAPSEKPSAEETGSGTLHETFRILPMGRPSERRSPRSRARRISSSFCLRQDTTTPATW